jgi:methionyl-tRNA formyltransferase
MRILLLCPYPEQVAKTFERCGDSVAVSTDQISSTPDVDWIVSYGFRHIIREPLVSKFAGRMVNLHISYLPWNRGADPNFWSWFDDTPKGVTLHYIDAGLDTGDIIGQREVRFGPNETLRTSYEKLQGEIAQLFDDAWPLVRNCSLTARKQITGGSYHRAIDKEPIWSRLPLGHDTPVNEIKKLGERRRQAAHAI